MCLNSSFHFSIKKKVFADFQHDLQHHLLGVSRLLSFFCELNWLAHGWNARDFVVEGLSMLGGFFLKNGLFDCFMCFFLGLQAELDDQV